MDSYQSFHPGQPMDDGTQTVLKSLSKLLKGICDPNTMGLLEDGDDHDENDWDSVYLRQIVANSPNANRNTRQQDRSNDWRSADFEFEASAQSLVSPHSPKAFAERASIKLDRRNSNSPRRPLPQASLDKPQPTPFSTTDIIKVQKSTPETMASIVHEDASPESNLTCTPESMESIENDADANLNVNSTESFPSINTESTETSAPTIESSVLNSVNEKISPFDDDGNIEIVLGSPPLSSGHIELPVVASKSLQEQVAANFDENVTNVTDTDNSTTESDTDTSDALFEAVIADINAEFVAKVDAAEATASTIADSETIDDIIEIGMDKMNAEMEHVENKIEHTEPEKQQSKRSDTIHAESAVDAPVDTQTDDDAPVHTQNAPMDAEIDDNAHIADTHAQSDGKNAAEIDIDETINNDAQFDAETHIDVALEVQTDAPTVVAPDTDDIITPKRVLFPETPKEAEEDNTIQSEETVVMANPPKQQGETVVERVPVKPLPVEKPKSVVPFKPPTSSSIRNVLVATAINTVVNYVVLGAGMYCIGLCFGARQVTPTNFRHRK